MGWSDVTADAQNESKCLFGRGDGIGLGGVHYNNAPHGGSLDIDIINADTGTADNFQIGPRGQNVCIGLGVTPNN